MTIQPARHECHACCLLRAGFLAFQPISGQHAWHSCRAGCIVLSENPQELATHMVLFDMLNISSLYMNVNIWVSFKDGSIAEYPTKSRELSI